MPHFIVEYTNNLREDGEIKNLLKKINKILIERRDVFPIGGIRSRAIELQDYVIADGTEDDAFVHAQLKIGTGRSQAEKTEACDAIFEEMKQHFSGLFERRYLGLSFELVEFQNGTYKHNNIHTRF
ncbi:5-carboxymethyl-2-hydroxymuconate Delta-isomerase [Alteribacillus sp. YIM 98480]|uniref:5-carboxymethyl-2-hydroxymuconate Delta-isomerase n=1 Tax=Alteribacillus sp. YIM 98480 TaxID=2606599 RepID=UPI00131B8EA1|nr:5-carboxymethyl-2-hydroxymuconate Delta-isomerase [Alteribacillus sp. YIM 98480]